LVEIDNEVLDEVKVEWIVECEDIEKVCKIIE
jgi:hypothetical protein